MVPNGTAYSNFPPFATNGTKTPPGGSPESAKYALGMVPADTFPAEWANYLFHGATAGITRLNQDTGSIKKEINSVLTEYNITPDATLNNQLLAALNKLKAEAALAAHPVGSLYWTSVNENPAITFGGGTWVQLKDRFILAAGDTYANGATGGEATVTLTTNEMPSHTHNFTPSGTIPRHAHGMAHWHNMGNHTHVINPGSSSAIYDVNHATAFFQGELNTTTEVSPTGTIPEVPLHQSASSFTNGIVKGSNTNLTLNLESAAYYTLYKYDIEIKATHQHQVRPTGWLYGGTSGPSTNDTSVAKHNPFGTVIDKDSTDETSLTFTGTEGTTGTTGSGQAHNNMPPYIAKYCWQRTA